jgi:hypothetical protein
MPLQICATQSKIKLNFKVGERSEEFIEVLHLYIRA